jgi:hypothetical protein
MSFEHSMTNKEFKGFPILRDFSEKGKYAKNVKRILRMRQDNTWSTHKVCFMNKLSSVVISGAISDKKIIKKYINSSFSSQSGGKWRKILSHATVSLNHLCM